MPTLQKHDNGFYYFLVKVNNKQKRTSLRTRNPKLARERYAEMADQFDRGLLDLKRKKPIPTFQQLFDEYLPYCKAHRRPRTYDSTESHIRRALAPFFGALRATDLEPKHLEDFVGEHLRAVDPETGAPDPYHPRTINLRLETLRKILNRAVENKVIPEMPCKIKPLKTPDSLPRYAYPDQVKEWMSYMDVSHRIRAVLSLMTGITDRDLGFVMLNGYDRQNAMLRFRRPKTVTDIVIPLTETAVQIMDFLVKDNPGPMLFSAAKARRAFYEASKKVQAAGGENLTPHMLRHSFATWLLSIGVPPSHLQQILGHKDIKTTMRYAKVMPEHLRATMDKIETPEFDIQALLGIPRKGDKRTGAVWTEEMRKAQSEAMKGNKHGFKTGSHVGQYEKKQVTKRLQDKKRPVK